MFITESYVADEIITSRAGVRVRVGNTDAEGRMVMADVLCKFKEMVSLSHLIRKGTLILGDLRSYKCTATQKGH